MDPRCLTFFRSYRLPYNATNKKFIASANHRSRCLRMSLLLGPRGNLFYIISIIITPNGQA
jgi:hypothetical protein